MKKALLNILVLSFVIATIGLLMDGDSKETSILMRFVEFFILTVIVFMVISTGYCSVQFIKRSVLKT